MCEFTGTEQYMAPEIIKRNGKYSEKVDVWSIGITTYLMVTG